MNRSDLWLLIIVSIMSVVGQACSQPQSETSAKEEPKVQSPSDVAQLSSEQQLGGPPSNVSYTVVDETVYDKPIKTQIEQHLLASGVPTSTQLEAELLRRYRAARERRGFRYHNPPTNIYIYIYGSKEQARARQGLWIGMIARGPLDRSDPKPVIDGGRLSALSTVPEERFGLSEDERRAAFKATVAAEDRATNEAMEQVPDTEIMKQIERERELQTKYKREIARKYGITDSQLTEIAIEGVKKGWPG